MRVRESPVSLHTLPVGSDFILYDTGDTGLFLEGTVKRIGRGSVSVALKGQPREVSFVDGEGRKHQFTSTAGRTVEWSLNTLVEPTGGGKG